MAQSKSTSYTIVRKGTGNGTPKYWSPSVSHHKRTPAPRVKKNGWRLVLVVPISRHCVRRHAWSVCGWPTRMRIYKHCGRRESDRKKLQSKPRCYENFHFAGIESNRGSNGGYVLNQQRHARKVTSFKSQLHFWRISFKRAWSFMAGEHQSRRHRNCKHDVTIKCKAL